MYEHLEKSKENKSRVVANSAAQKKSNVVQGLEVVNNRQTSMQKQVQMIVGNNAPVQMVNEYAHIVIDKAEIGLDGLRRSLNENGLQTAENRNIQLSEGSMKLKHHQHVFMWDGSKKGIEGAANIEKGGETIRVKIRMNSLSEPKWYSSGNLKGDGMGPLGGKSTNGAWAYQGDIPRKYLFIEGLDFANQPGFEDWIQGNGWPEGHAEKIYKTKEYKDSLGKLD
jgi:hypothetical protein